MRVCLALIFFIVTTGRLQAQLCQGSLGDPVVNITFGAGPNPGLPLAAATTNYQFYSSDCPNDGLYTVRNQTSNCFATSWQNLASDHTGDNLGYFMLVNASIQPNDFYVDTVKGLCPGTTFEFAAWLLNMLLPSACGGQGIEPNITFKIETATGANLKSFNTGYIPSTSFPLWKQYGFLFEMPDSISSVVVRMTNNAPGGCGNDIALDDITFRPCGPEISVAITGVDSTIVNICEDKNNTYGLTGKFTNGGYINPAFQWQVSTDNGASWSDIDNATGNTYAKPQTIAGDYQYRVAAAEKSNINNPICRVTSKVISIDVNPLPQIRLTNNSPVCTSDNLFLNAEGGSVYKWAGPNGFTSAKSSNTINNPSTSSAGRYYVTVTTDKACSSKDSADVIVYPAAVAKAGNDAQICGGNSTQLNGSGGVLYSWSPATGLSAANVQNPVASPADSTTYTLTVTDNNNCKATDSVVVNVFKKPVADAGPDRSMMEGQSVTLNATSAGSEVTYIWSPDFAIDNVNTLQPVVSPAQDATYTLTVSSSIGCGVASDNVFIKVFQKVIIPNTFSPNGDGINDTWNIIKLDTYPDADVYVYNRYGQAVFSSRGYNKPWNGTYNNKPLPVATYYYVIDLKNNLPKLSGWVLILR